MNKISSFFLIFYKKHNFIINTLLSVFIVFFVANMFVEERRYFLIGEYIFSFDYPGHLKNIINDLFSANILYKNNVACIDCPDFYHYSRWYSIFKIGFQSLGQTLGFNPFLFLLLTMISLQLMGLYVFVRTFFNKFNKYIFLVSSFFFIFNPYKFNLLVETHDGVTYTFLLLFISIFFTTIKDLKIATAKKLIVRYVSLGIIFSSFLNINIGFLPIMFYLFFGISLFFYKTLLKEKVRYISLCITIVLITLVVNFPLFISSVSFKTPYLFSDYISMIPLDAFSAGMYSAGVPGNIIFFMFGVFTFLFFVSNIKFSNKIKLLLIFAFVAWLVIGRNAIFDIYGTIFKSLPLMGMLRSLYRLLFFELLILFVVLYSGLSSINIKKIKWKIFLVAVSLFFLLMPGIYIWGHFVDTHTGILPNEYFSVKNYFKDNDNKKIYFPTYLPIFQSMTGNYSWYKNNKNSILYKNPFTSLLSLSSLVNFERYPATVKRAELRALTDLNLDPVKIISALEYSGIKYVIVDKNFLWEKNFPNFDLDSFVQNMHLEEKFGNLFIYSLLDKSKNCLSSYGNYKVGYCVTFDNLKNISLIDKTKSEYILEKFERDGKYTIMPQKNIKISNVILSPNIQDLIIKEKILLPFNAYQVDKSADIFSYRLNEGRYKLFIPVFKVTREYANLFLDSKIVIYKNKTKLKEISPINNSVKFVWEEVDVVVQKSDLLSVKSVGNGFLVLGSPLLIPKSNLDGLGESN